MDNTTTARWSWTKFLVAMEANCSTAMPAQWNDDEREAVEHDPQAK